MRGHRLVGGFTVNIRAIRDTAEISITCLAALILGAATSCRALCSAGLDRIKFDRRRRVNEMMICRRQSYEVLRKITKNDIPFLMKSLNDCNHSSLEAHCIVLFTRNFNYST